MQAFYSDVFELPLPAKHRFPMSKYRLLRERVDAIDHGLIELSVADGVSLQQLELVHSVDYLRRVMDGRLTTAEVRRIGFPWSPQLVERSRTSAGGTLQAARSSLSDGVAVNLAGGTHHAFADSGQGYCVFNDVAVAIRTLQAERVIDRAVVIDCDVHQGNGTASIFADEPRVFTFSMHGARNYPHVKPPSDLDIALRCGASDAQYLELLEQSLRLALPLETADLAFYLAGADPYRGDRLGKLQLSKAGLEQRDRLVLRCCRAAATPVAVVMAGGYAADVDDTVTIHATTVHTAADSASRGFPATCHDARTCHDD